MHKKGVNISIIYMLAQLPQQYDAGGGGGGKQWGDERGEESHARVSDSDNFSHHSGSLLALNARRIEEGPRTHRRATHAHIEGFRYLAAGRPPTAVRLLEIHPTSFHVAVLQTPARIPLDPQSHLQAFLHWAQAFCQQLVPWGRLLVRLPSSRHLSQKWPSFQAGLRVALIAAHRRLLYIMLRWCSCSCNLAHCLSLCMPRSTVASSAKKKDCQSGISQGTPPQRRRAPETTSYQHRHIHVHRDTNTPPPRHRPTRT